MVEDAGTPAGGMPPMVGELLSRLARESPDKTVYTHLAFNGSDPRSITYGALHRRACEVAGRLIALGLRGRPVLLLHPAGEEFAPAFFGAMLAGAVAVPVPVPQFPAQYQRLEGIAADCVPGAVLSTDAVAAKVLARLPAHSELRSCPWLTDSGGAAGGPVKAGVEPGSGSAPEPVAPSSIALLQYTSGSTSEPRGVAVTHANLAHNLRMIATTFRPPSGARIVSWLPHFHDMGLIVGVMGPLICDGESILMAPLAFMQRPLRWLETISSYRAQVSGAPNFAYELCEKWAARGELPPLDLSSWKVAFVGAEPVRFATLEAFASRFAPNGFRASALTPCYGMAEATLLVSCKPPDSLPASHSLSRTALDVGDGIVAASGQGAALTLTGCGYPAPGTDVRIVDPAGRVELPRGAVGEIWISGAQVAPGYWTQVDENPFEGRVADSGAGPFLRTGDIGFLAADGELVFVDRIKDVIVLNGQNHVCHDLERTAGESHPLLSPDGCVVVSLSVDEGSHLAVIAELPRAARTSGEEAAAAVRSALFSGHGLAVRTIAFVPPRKLSRTTSGKLQRRLNARRLESGTLELLGAFGDPLPSSPVSIALESLQDAR